MPDGPHRISASIIITSYNNAHNLARCLNSALVQDRSNQSEVIVVDSGSSDDTPAILRRYTNRIKIIWPPESWPKPLSAAQARNLGAERAKGDIPIFTDSDCVPGPQWLSKMLRWYRDSDIDCVIGNREPDEGRGLGAFVRRYDFILYSNKFILRKPISFSEQSIGNGEPFVLLASNNFSIKRDIWRKIGGMDTVFRFSGEDIMLEIDVLRSGGRIIFDPDNIVAHVHPMSLARVFRRAVFNGIATYLLGLYSNGLIGWPQFRERGRNFNMYLFVPLLFLGAVGLAIPATSKIVAGFGIALLFSVIFVQTIFIRAKLVRILKESGNDYAEQYQLSWGQTLLFAAIHFLLKLTASVSFFFAAIFRYGNDARRKIKSEK